MPNVSAEFARFGRRANSRSSRNSAILDSSVNSSSSRACHTPLIHSATSIRPAKPVHKLGPCDAVGVARSETCQLVPLSASMLSSAGSRVRRKSRFKLLDFGFQFLSVLRPRPAAGRIDAWT